MDLSNLRTLTLSKLLSLDDSPPPPQQQQQQKLNKNLINSSVESYNKLNQSEKLLFLLSINNCNTSPSPSLTQQQHSQERLQQTTTWLLENFKSDMQTALPKEEVYDFYIKTFHSNEKNTTNTLSTADFGKLMRVVFPSVKARRLGQRGQSKYCYANIRKKSDYDIDIPSLNPLPQLQSIKEQYLQWGKATFGIEFAAMETLLSFMKANHVGKSSSSSGIFNGGRKRSRSSSVSNKKEEKELVKIFSENKEKKGKVKKRHCSSIVAMDVKKGSRSLDEDEDELFFGGDLNTPAIVGSRSASVPIYSSGLNSAYNYFRSDSGYSSTISNQQQQTEQQQSSSNPLLSSSSLEIIKAQQQNFPPLQTETLQHFYDSSNDSSGELIMFDSVFDLIKQDLMEGEEHSQGN